MSIRAIRYEVTVQYRGGRTEMVQCNARKVDAARRARVIADDTVGWPNVAFAYVLDRATAVKSHAYIRHAANPRGEAHMTQVHYFNSTGEAYDATQCSDEIKDGDVLVIRSEGVVGIADTWPFAVTEAAGNLHSIDTVGNDHAAAVDNYAHAYDAEKGGSAYTDGVAYARALIHAYRPWFPAR